jgi:hypothetical protein
MADMMRREYWSAVVRSVFDQSGPANRQLRRGLAALLIFIIVTSLPAFLAWTPGTDLQIPLLAADRWASGGQPYVASSFALTSGTGLPFLYPPWLLPMLVPLLGLPRPILLGAWLILCAAVSVWTCRRFGFPWRAVPLVMLWPPFMEGLVVGNVQLFQLAAFAALFYSAGKNWQLAPRSLEADNREAAAPPKTFGRDLHDGLLAASVGALKYTQLMPILWLVRPRPRAAILGAAALVLVVVAMLPFTGTAVYGDWIAQLGRASDPTWEATGAPLSMLVGRVPATAVAACALGALFFVRGRDTGAWVGIALVVAAPSIHGYGMLFLLPALLILRRDLAIFLATLIARYNIYGWWISIVVTAVALAGSRWIPSLRSPTQTIDAAVPDQET